MCSGVRNDDLLISAFGSDANGTAAGSIYVVFGVKGVANNIDDTLYIPIRTQREARF